MPQQQETTINDSFMLTTKMERLRSEKTAALKLRERKHLDWDDNYLLYRNKVKVNRLTQRQAVNVPLMKETIKTLLSQIDEKDDVTWKERGGDEQKELFYQEIWNDQEKKNKFPLLDSLDKKNVLLYGISTTKLNIGKEGVNMSVLDTYDIFYDPLMLPWSIESARFIVQTNIFRTVKEILADDRYTKEGKEALKVWSISTPGIVADQKNKEEFDKKMERLTAMGISSGDFPLFAGGDRIVNLTEHYTNTWNVEKQKFEKRVVVYAEDSIELLDETLYDLIGVDFWPFVVWSEDPETNDIYPDSIADLVRVPNKVLNVWFSQMIENRTLKNFQMHWFLPSQGYTPQTYTPGPGVMLPAPPGEDINKVIKPVQVDGLDDTLMAMQGLIQMVEKGSGASAINKGTADKGTQTLGEVKILVGESRQRATAMAKFYRMACYERAWKWDKLMHANAPSMIKLHKVSRSGKSFPKTLTKGDWVSQAGYEPVVQSSSEKETNDTKSIQKFIFVQSQSPNNQALKKIALRRELQMLDLSSEELREVEEGEKTPVQQGEQPTDPNLMTDVTNKMKELQL